MRSIHLSNILVYFIIISSFLFSNILCFGQTDNDSISTKLLDEVIITGTKTKRQLSSLPLPGILISKNFLTEENFAKINFSENKTGVITDNYGITDQIYETFMRSQ